LSAKVYKGVTMIARLLEFCRPVVVAGLVVATLGASIAAQSQPRGMREFISGTDYRGLATSVTFDSTGGAWLATTRTLYQVVPAGLKEVASAASNKEQLLLAPGGQVYAWLDYARTGNGLFTARLVDTRRGHRVETPMASVSRGFSLLQLGANGKLVLTVSPINGPLAIDGEFRYDFWNLAGQSIAHVILPGRRTAVLATDGSAVLLLGPRDAIAYDNLGAELWRLRGSFRFGALSGGGRTALLNPDLKSEIDRVHVFRNGSVTVMMMRSPVHDLALSADGSSAAIAVDEGNLALLDPSSCDRTACRPREVRRLRPQGTDFYISEVEFLDPSTLAVATIDRTGSRPPFSYPEATLHVVEVRDGSRSSFPIALTQPAPGMPQLGVTSGIRGAAVHTPHRAYVLEHVP
jgi:hypothetical protein